MYTPLVPSLLGFYMEQIRHIRLEKIKPPDFDHRLSTTPEADNSLRDSIKELGVLEPILVKEVPTGFEIIFGNRRFREAGRAGLAAIPCIICKSTGAASDKIMLHENIQRLPLSDVDQAYTFAHLIKKYNMTETQVGTLVGKSIAFVSQHLSLLQCDDYLVQAVQDGRLNFSVARELIQCKNDDERLRFTNIIEENGATVSVVRGWVQESNRENDFVQNQTPVQTQTSRPAESNIPLYPCAACEVPVDILKMKTVRLCPECHYLIFSEIERQKQEARRKQADQSHKIPI